MNEIKSSPVSMIRKSYLTVIGIVTFFTLFGMGFFWLALFVLSQSFKDIRRQIYDIQMWMMIAMPAAAVIAIGILLYACHRRTRIVSCGEPVKYTVEDFLITSRPRDNKRKYTLHPVLRDVGTGELICAFGKYNKSVYSSVREQNGNTLNFSNIVRRDGSTVEIGDTVWVYIKRFVDIKADVGANEKYGFDKKTYSFNHINRDYDIEILSSLRFFEGLIDVEKYDLNNSGQ